MWEGEYNVLDSILEKTFNYLNACSTDIGWRNNLLLPMVSLNNDFLSYQIGEQIIYAIENPYFNYQAKISVKIP